MTSLGPIPRRDPLSYPGQAPGGPVVVEVGGAEDPLVTRLTVAADRGLEWSMAEDGKSLAQLLESLGSASMAERTPVLAIGSNASVAQMAHKYIIETHRIAYPQFIAEVCGMDVGYAPLVARYGAVPATVVPRAGVTVPMAVQYLDTPTLVALDETEGGYDRVSVSPADGVWVRLPNGTVLDSVAVYVARSGYLVDAEGPWLLGAGPGRLQQRDVMARLLGEVIPDGQSLESLVETLVRVPVAASASADGRALAELLQTAIDETGHALPSPYLAKL